MSKRNFLDLIKSPQDLVFKRVVDDPKYANRFIAYAAEKIGGVDRYVEWIKEDPKNEYAHWTKNFPKLVQNEKKEEAGEKTIEDLLAELDKSMIDVTPTERTDDAETQVREGNAASRGDEPDQTADNGSGQGS